MSSDDVLSLSSQLGKFQGMSNSMPPVKDWNPELSGDMDMAIHSDGRWFHEGTPFENEKLARLFSTILKKEGGEYFLVTPVEKWRIRVEDLPFIVVLANVTTVSSEPHIKLITATGDQIKLSGDHQLLTDSSNKPLILVRDGMYARLNRNVYYQLAELAQENDEGEFVIKSGGVDHVIG